MVARWVQYVRDAVRQPRNELTRRQHQLRRAWDLVAHCSRVLIQQRAEGMAAELAYRTIFALVPMVVLGLVVFRVMGGLEEIREQVEEQAFAFFGVPDIEYVELPPAPPEVPLDPPEPLEGVDAEAVREEVDEHATRASIRRVLSDLVDQVMMLDFASIGAVGLLWFLYAAIALTDSVEQLFNRIYDAPSSRSIHLRLAIQWTVITFGSGLLLMSFYLGSQFVEFVAGTALWPGGRMVVDQVLALLASWVLLFLLYWLLPNVPVSIRAAMIGALVAAVLWEIAKLGFRTYVRTALPYSAIYGSLGLIPLFLFWIYFSWLIILFGLVWTYTLQNVDRRGLSKKGEETEPTRLVDSTWMLPLMVEVTEAFERGRPIDVSRLSHRLKIPKRAVRMLVDHLVKVGLLCRVAPESSEIVVPSRNPDQISADQVLQLGSPRPRGAHGPAWEYLQQRLAGTTCEPHGTPLVELIRHPESGIGNRESGIGSPESKIQNPEDGDLGSEIGDRKPEGE